MMIEVPSSTPIMMVRVEPSAYCAGSVTNMKDMAHAAQPKPHQSRIGSL
jgi:hypothetical protein